MTMADRITQRVILAGAVLEVAFGGLLTLLNERISKGAVIGFLIFGASSMGLCDVPSVMLVGLFRHSIDRK